MSTDEQITLYAIGAMDTREAAEFERQLARSPELRGRVAEEKAAATALLSSVESIAPPPALKERVMARIVADASMAKPAQPRPARADFGEVLRYLLGGLSVAFAALAVVLGVGLMNTQSQVAHLQSQVAQLRNQAPTSQAIQTQLQQAQDRAAQLERELAQVRSELEQARQAVATAQANIDEAQSNAASAQNQTEQAQNELAQAQRELAVLNQPDLRSATLPTLNNNFSNGAINVFYSPDSKTALLTATNLPSLAANQTYQVWLIKDDQPLPSSVFNTASDGYGRLIVQSDEPFSAFDRLGITIEPAGGRPTPNPAGPIFVGPLG